MGVFRIFGLGVKKQEDEDDDAQSIICEMFCGCLGDFMAVFGCLRIFCE